MKTFSRFFLRPVLLMVFVCVSTLLRAQQYAPATLPVGSVLTIDLNLSAGSVSVHLESEDTEVTAPGVIEGDTKFNYAQITANVGQLSLAETFNDSDIAGTSSLVINLNFAQAAGGTITGSGSFVGTWGKLPINGPLTLSGSFTYTPPYPAYFPYQDFLARYPDLLAAFGRERDAALMVWRHYWRHGALEGRTDGFFDPAVYLASYADVRTLVGNDKLAAALHWYNSGWLEGRLIEGTFIAAQYLALNPDLQAAFKDDVQAAARHWYNFGRKEGRLGRVPASFDAAAYLSRYSDLRAAFGADAGKAATAVAAYQHFIRYGAAEGRTLDERFRLKEYLEINPDLKKAFVNGRAAPDYAAAAEHWFKHGSDEQRMGRVPTAFSAANYLNKYEDLKNAFGADATNPETAGKAFTHFLDYGVKEGRSDGSGFWVDNYLSRYSDLKTAFKNDLSAAAVHWYMFGNKEGRSGVRSSSFSSAHGLSIYNNSSVNGLSGSGNLAVTVSVLTDRTASGTNLGFIDIVGETGNVLYPATDLLYGGTSLIAGSLLAPPLSLSLSNSGLLYFAELPGESLDVARLWTYNSATGAIEPLSTTSATLYSDLSGSFIGTSTLFTEGFFVEGGSLVVFKFP